ncbi:MAG: hypothetical protein ACOX6O_11325 [Christensenellales bacterium]|jgi:hypothetical protein
MKRNDLTDTSLFEPEAPRPTWRDRFYGRIKVSVRTMDRIIIGLVAALVIILLIALITAGR